MLSWDSLQDKVREYTAHVDRPMDIFYDNLERQGFRPHNSPSHTWRSTHGNSIRNKATFDMQPTNPQTDIIPTGKCEIRVREVILIIPKATIRAENHIPDHANPISIENKAMLPQFTSKTRACIYYQDGKCVGMLSP